MVTKSVIKVVGLGNPEQAVPRPAPTGSTESGDLHDIVKDLITTYHDLNPTTVDVLNSEPSPLEFLRYVSQNRPVVIKNGAMHWSAQTEWSAQYLRDVMQGQEVNVALTPFGDADSIHTLPRNSGKLFVKPHERDEPFQFVLEKIQEQERNGSCYVEPTRYAQTQNDNLRGEYNTLFAGVPSSIPFARIALDKEPDAINFWLGNSHSTTALHKDNYENLYVQILGEKHFVLLPPVEAACVGEKSVLAATYGLRDENVPLDGLRRDDMILRIDQPEEYTPFATWDPDQPEVDATPFSTYSKPLRVTLAEGDMLYLPALWYHKVSQSCSEEGICCSVNYWYDLDFSGSFWATSSFVRGIGLLAQQKQDEEKGSQSLANKSDP